VRNLPDDTRAFRQRLLAGLLGFLLGLIALFPGVVYVVVWAARDAGWGSAAHIGAHLTIWSFIGAMAIGCLAMIVADHIHARLGWIRCCRCGRRLGAGFIACGCDPEVGASLARIKELQRRRRRHLVARSLNRVPSVVVGWLAVFPMTYLGHMALGRGRQVSALDVVAAHIALCALVAVLGTLLVDAMKMFKFAKRLRPRALIFLSLFAVWPCAGSVYMVCLSLLR
jgi:hypothetical protein